MMGAMESWPLNGPWVVTDDYQRARRIGNRAFSLGEVREGLFKGARAFFYVSGFVLLDDVEADEVAKAVEPFYGSLEGLKDAYPDLSEVEIDELVAECVFESTPMEDLVFSNPMPSLEMALEMLDTFMPVGRILKG